DPVLYGNLPPREISMKDVFRSGDSSKKFKIAEGQWYRYAPSYVSPAYHLLEGFPFIQEPPSGDLQERVLIRHHDYDQCFQSVQLLQWNSQVKFNVTVYRNLPTTLRCLLINRRSLLLALRLLWKTPIFPSNSRFPRLCAKCLLKLKRLVSILPMT